MGEVCGIARHPLPVTESCPQQAALTDLSLLRHLDYDGLRPIVFGIAASNVMNSGNGLPEVVEETRNVPDLECDRCGAAGVVTRGDVILCGPCYYAETVRERRKQPLRRADQSPLLAALQEIEGAVLDALRRDACGCRDK